jgi:hypothetical protein
VDFNLKCTLNHQCNISGVLSLASNCFLSGRLLYTTLAFLLYGY